MELRGGAPRLDLVTKCGRQVHFIAHFETYYNLSEFKSDHCLPCVIDLTSKLKGYKKQSQYKYLLRTKLLLARITDSCNSNH